MNKLNAMERGSWILVGVLDEDKLTETAGKKTKKKVFVPNCGYITFKDSKVVIFYSNDLAGTPSSTMMLPSKKNNLDLVHGLAPLSRWTGTESAPNLMFLH